MLVSHTLVLFICKSLATIFHLEHVKMKELLKIIKHTFRDTTYNNTKRFCFTVQHNNIVLMAPLMAEAD